ncbi:D-sedoheptulose 7-phosphate isomerase [bacterium]|nr:D-sedoheptulose 7-phosphate isomerase [bacterium]
MIDQKQIELFIQDSLKETSEMIRKIGSSCCLSIINASHAIIGAFQTGNKLLICGNGGSAADSQHIAAEMVVRFQKERSGLPAIALTTDTSILTAGGNDYGFDHVFARQVEALGQPGDIFLGLSTSGSSRNVVLAMDKAKSMNVTCIAMTGEKPGPLYELADIAIQIPHIVTARIQEGHMAVGHLICDIAEQELFP